MRESILTVVVLILIFIGTASPSPAALDTMTPEPVAPQGPNLTTISVGNHKTCGVNGAASSGSEKAKLNKPKNRFRLPSGDFEMVTFDDLLALNQGHAIQSGATKKIVGFPNSGDPNNQRAVTLEGFVDKVLVGGCSRHGTSGG